MLRLTRQMTTRACVYVFDAFAIYSLAFAASIGNWHAPCAGLFRIDRPGVDLSALSQHQGGHNEAEYGSRVAGGDCRWRDLDRLGFRGRHETGSALRSDAEAGIVPQGTALFAVHTGLDSVDIRDVDSHRAPLCLGSRDCWCWTEDGS